MNGPAGRKRKTQHTKKDAMKFVAKILTIAAALSSLSMGANQVTVDSSIRPYAPTSGVSGNLNAVGSDTLNNLMTLWAEGFSKKYPSVKVGVEGKGSSTAPPALTAGTAQLAPMSRQMKREEIAAFEAKYGYKPTEIKVALDTLTREFIKFIVSKDGQEIVTKDGYYPIPAKVSAEVLKSIE